MNTKILAGFLAVSGVSMAGAAYAQGFPGGMMGGKGGPMMKLPPAIAGKVTAESGNTLTVSGLNFGSGKVSTSTAYMVDATNATIHKGNATTTVAGIAIGDMVLVQGNVSGTNVAATVIIDGKIGPGMGDFMKDRKFLNASGTPSSTPSGTKNGKNGDDDRGFRMMASGTLPGMGIGGTVLTVGSTSLTIAGRTGRPGMMMSTSTASTTTFAVDASGAMIRKSDATTTLSGVSIGDFVMVQGNVSGTNVTAKLILDRGTTTNPGPGMMRGDDRGDNHNGTSTNGNGDGNGRHGLLGSIGDFFKNFFHF